MANPEHLEILLQGVDTWNQWRMADAEVVPFLGEVISDDPSFWDMKPRRADLRGADLRGANLSMANLSDVDLSNANLSKANLFRANFVNANLNQANLSEANISEAFLNEADLRGSDLSRANLWKARLNKANLCNTNLRNAKLVWADLSDADLRGADIRKANLSVADLRKADLSGATLIGATLREANLNGADLSGADLSGALLRRVTLSGAQCLKTNLSMSGLGAARLIDTKLDGAILNGACLWESQRAGWSIKDVICEFVYWDEDGEEKSIYSPGEFERLFADRIKVRLHYKDGISPLEIASLPALIKYLEELHPGGGLRLINIREDSGGAVVELTIESHANQSLGQLKQLKNEIEITAQRAIEYERKYLTEEKQRLQLEGALKQSDAIIDKLILRPSINYQGNNMGDTYNVPGQAGAVGQNAHAHDNTFNQIANHLGQSIDMPTLAKQLAELREAMSAQQSSSPQTAIALGKVAEAEIAAQENDPSKVVENLKAAGKWTLDLAKEIGKDVAVAAIKASMGMQ